MYIKSPSTLNSTDELSSQVYASVAICIIFMKELFYGQFIFICAIFIKDALENWHRSFLAAVNLSTRSNILAVTLLYYQIFRSQKDGRSLQRRCINKPLVIAQYLATNS